MNKEKVKEAIRILEKEGNTDDFIDRGQMAVILKFILEEPNEQ